MSYKTRSRMLESTASGTIPTFDRSSPFEWARNEIQARTNNRNRISFFYKESLRFLISKLGTLDYLNSENKLVKVKCIHANPERTIAKLHQENNIILPVVSVSQDVTQTDDDRKRNSLGLVLETYWSDERRRAYRLISLAPAPVNITYKINIWTKYKNDMDQLTELVRTMFNPQMVILNPYTNSSPCFISRESDASTLTPGDREDRIIRKSIELDYEAYLPNPKFLVTSTGEIEEFNADTTIY